MKNKKTLIIILIVIILIAILITRGSVYNCNHLGCTYGKEDIEYLVDEYTYILFRNDNGKIITSVKDINNDDILTYAFNEFNERNVLEIDQVKKDVEDIYNATPFTKLVSIKHYSFDNYTYDDKTETYLIKEGVKSTRRNKYAVILECRKTNYKKKGNIYTIDAKYIIKNNEKT